MFGLGVSLFQVAILLICLVALSEWWRLRDAGPNVVVQDFRMETGETKGEFLYVLGRRSGISEWFLGLFGLQAQISFSVTDDEVTRESAGPRGFESLYAPLAEIGSSRCSYYRAFWVLALSIFFYLYGLFNLLAAVVKSDDYARQQALSTGSDTVWGCLVLGTACYVWYAFSKRVLISVSAKGGVVLGISFKRSIVENVAVELQKAMAAVDLMNARILAKHTQS